MTNTVYAIDVIQPYTVGQRRSHRLLLACPNEAIFTCRVPICWETRIKWVTASTAQQHTGRIITDQEMQKNIYSYEKCQGIFLVMYIKQDQVFGISFERHMHRQMHSQSISPGRWSQTFGVIKCSLSRCRLHGQMELSVSYLKSLPLAQLCSSTEQQI